MKNIFLLLFTSSISLQAQQADDSLYKKEYKAEKVADQLKYISFSGLPRLKQDHSNHRVISSVNVTGTDTLLFNLAVFGRRIYCLPMIEKSEDIKNIKNTLLFVLCHFRKFEFSQISFDKDVNFKYSFFDKNSIFFQTVFNQKALFEDAHFANSHIFSHSTFKSSAIFDRSKYDEGLTLNSIDFENEVSFRNVDFSKGLSLYQVVFHRLPDFSDIQLPFNLVFNDISFKYDQLADQNAKIDFSSAKLDNLRADNKNPAMKCLFQARRTDFSRLILPYDRFIIIFDKEATHEEKISAYEAIIKSCREAGLTESVEGWDVEYRKLQNTYKFGKFGDLINLFNEQWWNFGYEKWRILVIWLPFFFACFLLYNFFHIEHLWNSMYKDNELGKSFLKRGTYTKPPTQYGWEKFAFTFFYTAVIYFGFKVRHEAVNYKNTRGLLYLYLMYAVGTIHMAFAFSYILSAY